MGSGVPLKPGRWGYYIRLVRERREAVYPACQMVAKSKPPEPSRDQRLAAALRENLKRRKAQARAKEHPAKAETAKDKSPSR